MLDEKDQIAQRASERPPPPRHGRLLPAWAIYALALLPIVVAYPFLPNTILPAIAYDAIALSCVVAILLGARLNRPSSRVPWYLLATGVALWLSGDLMWSYFESQNIAPFPSIADALYLAAYPFFASGVYLLARSHAPKRDRSLLIDSAIITIGVGVLAWMFLMSPYATGMGLSFGEKAVSMAYPLGDLLILSVLVRALFGARGRPVAYLLIAGGLVLSISADTVYGLMLIEGTYYTGHIVDLGWLLFYASWGAAALHPSMAAVSRAAADAGPVATPWRLAFMAAAAVLASTVGLIQHARGEAVSFAVITAASIAMFLLVTLRMGGLLSRLQAAFATVRRVEQEKGRLLDRTMRIGEEERERIAGELHDGPIQQLSALSYRFEAGLLQLEEGNHDAAAASLGQVRDSFGEEIKTLRALMSGLRSPELDKRGLETTLRDQLAAFRGSTRIETRIDVDLSDRLPQEVETALFRMVQEGLNNVAKHSQASAVHLELRGNADWAQLSLADDGVGFETKHTPEMEEGRFGLTAMRQRIEVLGGEFEVRSSANGTVISATFGEVRKLRRNLQTEGSTVRYALSERP